MNEELRRTRWSGHQCKIPANSSLCLEGKCKENQSFPQRQYFLYIVLQSLILRITSVMKQDNINNSYQGDSNILKRKLNH